MHYTTQLGRNLFRKQQTPLTLAVSKWPTVLPATHRFKWNQVWMFEQSKTEVGFISEMWHKVVALMLGGGIFPLSWILPVRFVKLALPRI